jgi:hypothetical protein
VAIAESNQTFLDWVVVTCDRLLAGYALNGHSGVQEDGTVQPKSGSGPQSESATQLSATIRQCLF